MDKNQDLHFEQAELIRRWSQIENGLKKASSETTGEVGISQDYESIYELVEQ